ncbi:MAG: Stp1/IreP family PP2C-type Ser/Thr phosphatase [Myxococcales bacterium]|nr:Stp1/IreP family PP2C-type Ser/Thr phosphatase [Myxococcales bacterium]MCB9525669.1 Stp1/IreP family PP2C-type Ser/Thr phosphatase [Myxococcales bacterium]
MSNTNRGEIRAQIPRVRTATPDFQIRAVGATNVGRRREANEDSYLMLPKNGLFIVADGMGGHAGGQVASTLTAQTCAQAVLRRLGEAEQASQATGRPVPVADLIEASVREACHRVYDTARRNLHLSNMGSTVTFMLAYGGHLHLGHVGDSRAYLVRDDQIHQVTEDHSLVQEQVAQGIITPEQAKVSMMRNIITRSIGYEREVQVDTAALPVRKGDKILLCSDGLTGHVEDREILDHVRRLSLHRAPEALIELANRRGGDDNTTIVLAEIGGGRGKQRRKHQR